MEEKAPRSVSSSRSTKPYLEKLTLGVTRILGYICPLENPVYRFRICFWSKGCKVEYRSSMADCDVMLRVTSRPGYVKRPGSRVRLVTYPDLMGTGWQKQLSDENFGELLTGKKMLGGRTFRETLEMMDEREILDTILQHPHPLHFSRKTLSDAWSRSIREETKTGFWVFSAPFSPGDWLPLQQREHCRHSPRVAGGTQPPDADGQPARTKPYSTGTAGGVKIQPETASHLKGAHRVAEEHEARTSGDSSQLKTTLLR
ncbi:Hypothetical predicted protein [Podarcis lilfordi]|uniref:Uncharacterized protein n=1 Tax=Podarcis lilfordi TaxID=74358 RepID=A0AA35PH28_9SAUR|nr:Hypothetical predicted protein [Podarcis lilfordi]